MLSVPAAAGSGLLIKPLSAGDFLQEPPESPSSLSKFRFLTPPVIQWSTPESFEVFAITSHPSFCSVKVREKGSGGGFNTVTNQQQGLLDANETFHRITIPGLSPGKEYEYRLLACQIKKFDPYQVQYGTNLNSELFTVSLPRPGEPELRFTVLNDLHKNIPLITSLMGKVETSSTLPQFVMLNGDILSHIEGEEDVAAILNLPGKYSSEHPLIWIRGNHECRGEFARYMTRYLPMPDGRFYYTFRRGPVQFLVLDCGEDKDDADPEYSGLTDFDSYRLQEEKWFQTIIKSPEWKNAPFRILVSHIPIGHIPGDEERNQKFFHPYQKRWAKIMNKAGLDLEISAHYHRYYLEEPSDKRNFPIVIGGGPRKDSAVIVNVHATEDILRLEVTNLKDEIIGTKSWPRKSVMF